MRVIRWAQQLNNVAKYRSQVAQCKMHYVAHQDNIGKIVQQVAKCKIE